MGTTTRARAQRCSKAIAGSAEIGATSVQTAESEQRRKPRPRQQLQQSFFQLHLDTLEHYSIRGGKKKARTTARTTAQAGSWVSRASRRSFRKTVFIARWWTAAATSMCARRGSDYMVAQSSTMLPT